MDEDIDVDGGTHRDAEGDTDDDVDGDWEPE